MKPSLAASLAFFMTVAACADAQWLNQPTPNIPRTADGKPDLAAAPPQLLDGHSDLSGVWTNRGAAFIGLGLAAMAWPGIPLVALVWLFAVFALVDGASSVALGMRCEPNGTVWWTMIFLGVLARGYALRDGEYTDAFMMARRAPAAGRGGAVPRATNGG